MTNPLEIYRTDGLKSLCVRSMGYLYRNTLRKMLPVAGPPIYNGIEVVGDKHYSHNKPAAKRRLFDGFFPPCFHRSTKPNEEGGLVAAHKCVTERGDDVLIAGGGWGVTMGNASKIVGEGGSVTVFEGSNKLVEDLHRVAKFNDIEDICTIRHGLVGDDTVIWGGEKPDDPVISPTDLPECDVFEMDCQGAEYDILEEMEIQPRAMIIELHPKIYEKPLGELRDLMEEQGYEITHSFDHDGVAVPEGDFERMYDKHMRGERLDSKGLRNPPVIISQKRSN